MAWSVYVAPTRLRNLLDVFGRRLVDLSAENARKAAASEVLIAVNTDSHSMGELGLIRCGIDQARRAGLAKLPS